jgi:glycosyltransferase involved in cell wall biosynthesis
MHMVVDGRCIHAHMGGIGVVAKHLLGHWGVHARGHRITVLIGPQPPVDLQLPGIAIHRVGGGMIDEAFEQVALPDVLADLDADLYLNPTFAVPSLKTTAAQVAIIHDVVFEDHPEWVEDGLREYLQRAARFSAVHADRIITVSDYSRQRICELYGVAPERVTRIYNPVPDDAFEAPDQASVSVVRRELRLPGPYALFLGTIEIKKGIRELLDAFGKMCARGHPGSLVLAGAQGGPSFDLAAAIERAGAPGRIVHLGYVQEQWKKPILAGADLLVYPSLYEGFGMPPLEAMALGVPCLVNDATSLPEVVGDTAIRVDVRDGEALIRGLVRGLSDATFRSHARRAGPERARSLFDRRILADRFLDICESTLASAVV